MTLPAEPFHLSLTVERNTGLQPVPMWRPFALDPDRAEVVCAVDEFDHVYLTFDSPDPEALLTVEGVEREFRPGASRDLAGLDGHESDYPWYPGSYAITVQAGGRLWHGLLQIRPRHLPHLDDLERLRHDLEGLLQGLSLDLNLQRGYIGRYRARPRGGEPALRLGQLWLLKQALAEVEPALQQIAFAPQRRLEREHAVVPWHQARRLDGASFRWLARGTWLPHGQAPPGAAWHGTAGAVLAPQPVTSYDTYENRVVAFILDRFAQRADELAAALARDIALVQGELQLANTHRWNPSLLEERLANYQRLLRQVQETAALFRRQRRLPWFDRVSPLAAAPRPSMLLLQDPRYRTLYGWYRRLAGTLVRVDTADAAFAVRAKRTSLLYEYWCLFRIMDLLSSLGFHTAGGWLVERLRSLNRDRLVPVVPPGAVFELTAGERMLRIVYDRELPQTSAIARDQGLELYIASARNRPDIRIDLYRSGRYLRSLVLDAKYSRASSIWDDHRYGERMAQLQSYVYNLFHVNHPGRQIVRTAIALYPGRYEPDWQEREGGRVALARLAPGVRNEVLYNSLRDFALGGE